MAPRVEAIVEPELLVWARKKAGFDVEVVAKKARVSPEKLAVWEAGNGRPTVKQLRRLAHVYGRRLAFFYLPAPPRDFPPIKDYRVAWGERREGPSPELLAEIEAAYERGEVALELLEAERESPPPFRPRAGLEDDPDALAERLRRALGIDLDAQFEWEDARTGFNAWRFAIEAIGALVLQMTRVDPLEARGFSIAERPLPVVVANNGDPYAARSFTIVHELVHVAVRESGICDLSNRGRVEPFCNHVAGAVLVPARALLAENVVRDHGADFVWQDGELQRLARRYGASREVILRRLLILGRTNDSFYRRKRRELLDEYERRMAERPAGVWGPSPATIAVVRAGHYFSRLVLSRYSHGGITASDVAAYLGVRMKHVPSIEQAVFGPARE